MSVRGGASSGGAGVGSLRQCAAAAGLVFGLALAGPGLADARPYAPAEPDALVAAEASPAVRQAAASVLETADNQGLPFLIIDKVNARAFAFDRDGRLLGATAVLVGLTPGDVSPPGIGDRPLSGIGPEDRITPAGRFMASLGENLAGKSILWLDYDSALSLHPVVTSRASERRAQRLATATAEDNRISYGCVNVPPAFYEEVVQDAFEGTVGVVYILPETGSAVGTLFPAASPGGQDAASLD